MTSARTTGCTIRPTWVRETSTGDDPPSCCLLPAGCCCVLQNRFETPPVAQSAHVRLLAFLHLHRRPYIDCIDGVHHSFVLSLSRTHTREVLATNAAERWLCCAVGVLPSCKVDKAFARAGGGGAGTELLASLKFTVVLDGTFIGALATCVYICVESRSLFALN